jgi:glycine cleavage system H protein
MTAVVDTLVAMGVFLAGMAARLGLVIAVMLALLVPVTLLAVGVRAVRALELRLQGYRAAGRLRFRDGLRYAPGHTWVKAGDDRLRVGLDDLGQALLPSVVAVDLPLAGRAVREGEPVARISCGAQEAWVASPVSGTVVARNESVLLEPARVKGDCYGGGWLFEVEPDGTAWRSLPGGEAARAWLQAEGERLGRFHEEHLGYAAADGGELIGPPTSLLGAAEWRELRQAFLRT